MRRLPVGQMWKQAGCRVFVSKAYFYCRELSEIHVQSIFGRYRVCLLRFAGFEVGLGA